MTTSYLYSTVSDPSHVGGTDIQDISDRGDEARYYVDSNGAAHGFLTRSGCYIMLNVTSAPQDSAGTASGEGTFVRGINGNLDIVGTEVDTFGSAHGFIYSGGTWARLDEDGQGAVATKTGAAVSHVWPNLAVH